MSIHIIYATAPDKATALSIAQHLVAQKLAACVNILGPIDSVYEWEGKVNLSQEIAFLIKTTEAQVAKAIQAITEKHPYEVPAILAWPIVQGAPEFLNWISSSVTV